MPDLTQTDLLVADRLEIEFRKSKDAGWKMVNDPHTWIEDCTFMRIRQELIRRGVLFACPCGRYDNETYDKPVPSCDHDEDDAPRDEYERDGDDFDPYEEEDEDPLKDDVEPTGGYYDPQPSPLNTQHYHALQSRGLL